MCTGPNSGNFRNCPSNGDHIKLLLWTVAETVANVVGDRTIHYGDWTSNYDNWIFGFKAVQQTLLNATIYAWLVHINNCNIQLDADVFSSDETSLDINIDPNDVLASRQADDIQREHSSANLAAKSNRLCCSCCRTWSRNRALLCVMAASQVVDVVFRVLLLALYDAPDHAPDDDDALHISKAAYATLCHAVYVSYGLHILWLCLKKVRPVFLQPTAYLLFLVSL